MTLIGHGVFVAVVGPSGAGKDTLIEFARRQLEGRGEFRFVRRVVTRASDPRAEDHDAVDEIAFVKAVCDGAFAVHWTAHGFSYGLPRAIDADIAAGRAVVANVSRAVLPDLKTAYRHVTVVRITARADVLAARLAARGRETAAEVEARLRRDVALASGIGTVVDIDNSGPLDEACGRFVAFLEEAVAAARRSDL
jgi:ribose 1,5-bisphosphokinase